MTKKILLVEVEAQSALSETKILQKHGFEVRTTEKMEHVPALAYNDPEISLILLDTSLENENKAAEIARGILSKHSIPVVFLIPQPERRYTNKVRQVTGYGFVVKNSDEFILIETINTAFRLFAAHQATMESEAKYRAAFMTSPDSININRMDGLYVDINEGFTTLTGYTRDEVLGKLSSDIDIWAQPEDRTRLIEGLKSKGSVDDLESLFRCKDGSLKTGLMSARIVTINNEAHILSITRDITSKKETERQLKKSEHRYRSIFEQAAEGILIGNNQGIITDTNLSMIQLTGYSREELIGSSINMLFEPDKLAEKPLRYDLVSSGTSVQRERSVVTKSGKELPVIMNTKKVEDDCLQAIFHDLSELRESEDRFRLAVEGSRDGLWDWNLTTNEAFYSDRVAAMLGYEPSELPNTRDEWTRLIHPEDRQTADHQVDEYLKGKKDFYESSFRMQAKDGSYRWITARGKALFNEDGIPTRFVGFNTDITAQKEQTAAVERLLSEKEHLLQEVNHRVKNNLAMVSSLINLKQSTLKEKVDLSDLKHQINAIRIVHDKLHSTQEFTSIDFQSYCRELLAEIFSTPASPPVELKLDIIPLSLPVKTIIPLGLIINEIATNAIKYGFSPGSQARFTVCMIRDAPRNQISLSLANSGRRFEQDPHLRSEETVGLRLVDALINQLRGTLHLETEPQTNFTLVFPIPEEETL